MVRQVRSVSISSCVKILAFLYAFIGIFVGGMFSLFAILGARLGPFSQPGAFGSTGRVVFGIGSIIFFPILYAGIGAISGLICGGAYNVAAGVVGGIELELGDET